MPNKELNKLKNVGPATIAQLSNLGIQSLQDLCFHLPVNYQDKTKITQISDIDVGDEVLVRGQNTICSNHLSTKKNVSS